ncbi:MAG: hypothetical protein ACYC2K_16115 [Gemmatimonadales bacterium]
MSDSMNGCVRLSQQFAGFASVDLPAAMATKALADSLRRFGPVREATLHGLAALVAHLSPVKSFPTTYAIVDFGAWSLVLNDMKDENCSVNALAISRVADCRGIAVTAHERRRQLHIYEKGQKLRSVLSLDDGDRWHYMAEGERLAFESPADSVGQLSKRLPVSRVREYFEAYTGLQFPRWRTVSAVNAVGVTRSLADVRVEILQYETIDDLGDEP